LDLENRKLLDEIKNLELNKWNTSIRKSGNLNNSINSNGENLECSMKGIFGRD